MEKILGKFVSISKRRAEELQRKGIPLDFQEMVDLADRFSKGVEGIHVIYRTKGILSWVVRGKDLADEREYSLIRTIWKGDAGIQEERSGLRVYRHRDNLEYTCRHIGFIPYAHGHCPFCI